MKGGKLMDIKKILIIFLLVVVYSVFFWPTLYIHTNTAQNILVRINRITGEAYYFLGDGYWRKISHKENNIELGKSGKAVEELIEETGFIIPSEEEEEKIYNSGFKPLEHD
jgi:hypothetical protein